LGICYRQVQWALWQFLLIRGYSFGGAAAGLGDGFMAGDNSQIPDMSLDELFASARAMGNAAEMAAFTLHFHLIGCDAERGTLTISRNPTATRWMTTVGIAYGERYHARIAQGQSVDEALDKIERYCHWWLRL
jgi:hypothetical protein